MACNTSPTDTSTLAALRRALDDIIADRRFAARKSISALDIAEHLLAQAAAGERDIDRLKASAFSKLLDDQGGDASSASLQADMIPRSRGIDRPRD
jgi:hypothetical protein